MFLLLHRHYMVSKNTFLGTDLKTKKIEIAEKNPLLLLTWVTITE